MAHDASVIELLATGEIDIVGRMANSSNATFLVTVGGESSGIKGIYKPLVGERPLWDFPPGLYKREVAAFRLSEALGFSLLVIGYVNATETEFFKPRLQFGI